MAKQVSDAELKRSQRTDSRYLFNKRLIAEVRKRPSLWKHDHRNAVTSERLFGVKGALEKWEELGAVFGLSGEVVRLRWRYIRDTFTRKWRSSFGKRKVEFETAKALAGCVKWPFYKELLFLFEPDPASSATQVCGEETTNGSTSSDAVTHSVEETASDTTCSGDLEPSDPLEPLDAVEPSDAVDASDPVEPSDAVKALAEKMINGSTTPEEAEPSAREEAAACTGGGATQLPVENAITPTSASTPKINLCPSLAKRRRLLQKGLVVSDVRSIRDDSSVSKPTKGPSLPVNRPSLPFSRPSPPVNGLSLPASGLSPGTAEVSESSAFQAERPAIKSSSTAPTQIDHISHFLFSLERYVRKTADEIQPQLMMELLNVASSYSAGVYPVLLFPRTGWAGH